MNMQTPASHRNDPETSYIAESAMNKSGRRQLQQELVYKAVRDYPLMTSAELAEATGLDRAMIARRLKELSPRVIRAYQVKCAIKGTLAYTWCESGYPIRRQAL